MTTMVHRRPQSSHDDLQYGFNHLANHNAQWQDEGGFGHPGQTNFSPSLMSQNGPQTDFYMNQGYNGGQFHQVPHDGSFGLGVQYPGFDTPPQGYYPDDGQGYHHLAYLHAGMHEATPMTPGSTVSESTRRTRSGRSITRSSSPHAIRGDNNRVTKPSRVKKPKASKTVNNKTPKLNAPLSELTKDMNDIPVRDMEQWVNRADDQRHQEVEKRNGYITRPMNSFMLYRSAYADRTKQWCLQNNHQVVSAVSGESWPLEPKEIRDFYNNLAKVERDNHARAHPSYKFSPSKTTPAASNAAAASRKKKTGDLSDEEDDDGLDEDPHDMDGEWRPRNDRRGNNGNSGMGRRRQGREAGFPAYMHHHAQHMAPPLPQQHSGFFLDDPHYGLHSGMNGINDTIASSPWSDMMSDGGRPNTALPAGFTEMYGNSPFSSAFHSPVPGGQIPMGQQHPDIFTGNPFQQQFQQQQRQQNAMPTAIPGMSDPSQFFRSNAPSPAPPHASQQASGEAGHLDPLLLHSSSSPKNSHSGGADQTERNPEGGATAEGEHSGGGDDSNAGNVKPEGETMHSHQHDDFDIFGDDNFGSEGGDTGRNGDGASSAAHKGLEEWMEETSTS